jgi:FHS family L-fucose permease-like MFS transporter
MKQYTAVSERTAAGYLTATLVALAVGRFFSTQLMKYVFPSRLLGIYAAVNVVLLSLAIARPGLQGAYAIVVSSFFLSLMFPTIFALGLKGLGPNTKLAGSFLVMAIAGGAAFPPILGLIARRTGSLALGYVVPLMGYVVVSIYGFLERRIAAPRAL